MAILTSHKHGHTEKHATNDETPAQGSTALVAVTRDRIRDRAYEIFQGRKRNGHHGDHVSDWLQAEREINGSQAASASRVESKVQHGQHESVESL